MTNIDHDKSFIDLQMREDVESNTGLNLEFSDDFPDSSFIVLD